jgi:hypothetical protein
MLSSHAGSDIYEVTLASAAGQTTRWQSTKRSLILDSGGTLLRPSYYHFVFADHLSTWEKSCRAACVSERWRAGRALASHCLASVLD